MELIENNRYRLSTGREFYANCGVIGMSESHAEDTESDSLPQGYDGGIALDDMNELETEWTVAEKQELADFMIELWVTWKKTNSTERHPR